MWRRSLISLKVRLASIRLSNALPIFLIATSSRVSAFIAALSDRDILTRNFKKVTVYIVLYVTPTMCWASFDMLS
ncbi:hypothetical protein HanPSC8_Chr04g0176521 [Helianthus annuus]|nr:hypothetical protein HanPSC8_Chr04g0176521 [Helianthus annuus]